jgi:hypothetical protein
MGSSYVEFRGKGFWSWDGYLCDLLGVLATTPIERSDPTWLAEARKEWLKEESKGICRWVSPQLSEILDWDDRVQTFLRLIDEVQRRPDLTPELAETLTLLIALLEGELTTDASSPLDYVVQGKGFPYHGALGELIRTRPQEGHRISAAADAVFFSVDRSPAHSAPPAGPSR